MEQRELVERLLRRGETDAEELLRHYRPLMKYVIAPILPDPKDREDCLSKVALRVWERIRQLDRKRGSWVVWLTALTRSTALSCARDSARRDDEILSEQTPSREPGPEEIVLQREWRAAVQRALEELPTESQALLYRKYYYRQSTAQIAAELGLTERTVGGKPYRLKKRLRKSLGGEGRART